MRPRHCCKWHGWGSAAGGEAAVILCQWNLPEQCQGSPPPGKPLQVCAGRRWVVSYPKVCHSLSGGTAQVALHCTAADGEAAGLTGWALPGPGRLGRWSWAADHCRSRGARLGHPQPCPPLELPHTLYAVGHAGTKRRHSSCQVLKELLRAFLTQRSGVSASGPPTGDPLPPPWLQKGVELSGSTGLPKPGVSLSSYSAEASKQIFEVFLHQVKGLLAQSCLTLRPCGP